MSDKLNPKNIKPIFKERFLEMLNFDENEYNKFVNTILTPQRKSFRINTIKAINPDCVAENIQKKGFFLTKIPWSTNSYFVEYDKNNRTDIGNLYEHFLGLIYIQEATSMCPVEALNFPKNITEDFKVLDMASAPGSKTTQLGEKLKNKGIIIANELDYKRISPLKLNLEKSGLLNVAITINDARKIEGKEIFDRIILDAPCSGSGVIRKSPKTLIKYNPKKLNSISKLQLQLLNRAFELLKPNCEMTYSTCSLDPEENEFVIMKFLKTTPSAKLEKIKLNGLILNNRLKIFQGTEISKEVYENTIRIWPQDNNTNGFYLAKIKKIV